MTKKNDTIDIDAWLNMVKEVTPIATKKIAINKTPTHNHSKQVRSEKLHPTPFQTLVASLHPLKVGDKSDIDRKTVNKIDAGTYPIDGTIDLHGFTQETAFAAFERFILTASAKNYRLVLVIVGKGEVLRHKLPVWANVPTLRSFILRISIADAKNGGRGAFYIFLKRQRNYK